MNKSTLMRIRIDYLQNKLTLPVEDYKDVIIQLIEEVERLQARDLSNRIIIENLRRNNH